MNNKKLGENIKEIRKSLNLTQEQFAEQLNLNEQFISQIETGKAGISLETAVNICKLKKCSSTYLFNGIIDTPTEIEKYEQLNERDKSIINKMIDYLLNTK